MYAPALFAESRPDVLHSLMRAHPLGMLVTQRAAGLEVDHLPFLLNPEGTEAHPLGTLQAHVARANPVWQEVREGDAVLVVFRGAEGYISPNWYASKPETHRHVPTWNYEAVHVHGRLRIREDEKFLRGVLARLTRVHEADQPVPWRMGDAPADYLRDMLGQIVGIEVDITRIEGKRKLSQNREPRDFASTLQALDERGSMQLAAAMRRSQKG